MKRNAFFTSIALSPVILLSMVSPVYARDASASARPAQVRNEAIKEAKEEFHEKVQEARQTYRSARAKIHGERLQNHFDLYNKRLSAIATRIQTGIDKKKADGKDISSAQSKLDTAKATLASAVSDGQKAIDMFAAITIAKWDVQQPQIKAAIEQAQKARGEFIDTRKQLLDAATALRASK